MQGVCNLPVKACAISRYKRVQSAGKSVCNLPVNFDLSYSKEKGRRPIKIRKVFIKEQQ